MRLNDDPVVLVRALAELAPGMAVYLYPCNVHGGRAERTVVTSIYETFTAGSENGEYSDSNGPVLVAGIEPLPGHHPAVIIGPQMVDNGVVWRVVSPADELIERADRIGRAAAKEVARARRLVREIEEKLR